MISVHLYVRTGGLIRNPQLPVPVDLIAAITLLYRTISKRGLYGYFVHTMQESGHLQEHIVAMIDPMLIQPYLQQLIDLSIHIRSDEMK